MSDEEGEELDLSTMNPVYSDFIEFTNKEINRLMVIRHFNVSRDKKSLSFPVHLGGRDKNINYVVIHSMVDEWYIIELLLETDEYLSKKIYYKCDTIDGIIQYLKDEDLIPTRIPGIPITRLPE